MSFLLFKERNPDSGAPDREESLLFRSSENQNRQRVLLIELAGRGVMHRAENRRSQRVQVFRTICGIERLHGFIGDLFTETENLIVIETEYWFDCNRTKTRRH